MADPTRFRRARKVTLSGAGYVTLYEPVNAGDTLNLRQLAVSTDTAIEIVLFYGTASGTTAEAAARDDDTARIWSHEPAANGGAAPDLSCLGAWAPSPGRKVRLWGSAAADIHVSFAGTVE